MKGSLTAFPCYARLLANVVKQVDIPLIQESMIGGGLIGLASVALMLSQGRIAGISSITYRAIFPSVFELWSLFFIAGLVIGPLLLVTMTDFEAPSFNGSWLSILVGGFFVGIGTRLGSGCTSGHGVCGIGRGSVRSLIATLTFMVFGVITVFLLGFLP